MSEILLYPICYDFKLAMQQNIAIKYSKLRKSMMINKVVKKQTNKVFYKTKLALLTASCLGIFHLPSYAETLTKPSRDVIEIKGLMSAERIAGEYLVSFKADTSIERIAAIHAQINKDTSNGIKVGAKNASRLYSNGKMLAVKLDDAGLMTLANNPQVAAIEVNKIIEIENTNMSAMRAYGTPWGIDRIDQPNLPLDGQYSSVVNGLDTNVYILDTGIFTGHNEFEGRASWAYTAPGVTGGNDDNHGHGTYMAGLVGAKAYGVAPQSKLHSVKVLDSTGSGTLADLLSGLEYVQHNHQWPAVALVGVNLPQSTILTDAIDSLVDWGVSVAVPAGDESKDKCDSGLNNTKAMVVAASSLYDEASPYTNHGGCVDMYAPGLWVKSTWHSTPNANNTMSHSPVAAAHVAGAMALVRGDGAFCSAQEVNEKLVAYARFGELDNVPSGTVNRLLGVPNHQFGFGNCNFPLVQDNNAFYNKADFIHYNSAVAMDDFQLNLPVDTVLTTASSAGVTVSVDTGNFTVHSQGTLLEPENGNFTLTFDKSVNYIGFDTFITGATTVTALTDDGQSYPVYLTSYGFGFIGVVSSSPIHTLKVNGSAGSMYNDFQGVN